jgi:hypothetical protein
MVDRDVGSTRTIFFLLERRSLSFTSASVEATDGSVVFEFTLPFDGKDRVNDKKLSSSSSIIDEDALEFVSLRFSLWPASNIRT